MKGNWESGVLALQLLFFVCALMLEVKLHSEELYKFRVHYIELHYIEGFHIAVEL